MAMAGDGTVESGGITVERASGGSKPPLSAEDLRDDPAGLPPSGRAVAAGVPGVTPDPNAATDLHPAVIRLTVGVGGRLASELTNYKGFEFTEQEIQDLVDLWAQAGIKASPMIQAIIGTASMGVMKVGGYVAWKRAGEPDAAATNTDKGKTPESQQVKDALQ